MIQTRPHQASDSLIELTSLLHRACTRLGAMGLNYTAVDQTSETTAKRIRGDHCFVATADMSATISLAQVWLQPTSSPLIRATRGPASVASCCTVQKNGPRSGFAELAMDTAEQATHLKWPGKVYRSVVLSKPLASNG